MTENPEQEPDAQESTAVTEKKGPVVSKRLRAGIIALIIAGLYVISQVPKEGLTVDVITTGVITWALLFVLISFGTGAYTKK